MRPILIATLLALPTTCAMAADPPPELTEVWSPVPPKVSPGRTDDAPPSDAVILFDGKDLSAWEAERGGPANWTVEGDAFVVRPGAGAIRTRESFSDCQLHLEWMTPADALATQKGQDRGNSGVFLQGRYEVQILDSHDNPTYVNGQAGAIYKQSSPLVNACKPAGPVAALQHPLHRAALRGGWRPRLSGKDHSPAQRRPHPERCRPPGADRVSRPASLQRPRPGPRAAAGPRQPGAIPERLAAPTVTPPSLRRSRGRC
jgi:hypothetical protein